MSILVFGLFRTIFPIIENVSRWNNLEKKFQKDFYENINIIQFQIVNKIMKLWIHSLSQLLRNY